MSFFISDAKCKISFPFTTQYGLKLVGNALNMLSFSSRIVSRTPFHTKSDTAEQMVWMESVEISLFYVLVDTYFTFSRFNSIVVVNMFLPSQAIGAIQVLRWLTTFRSCILYTKQSENGNDDELIVLQRDTHTHSRSHWRYKSVTCVWNSIGKWIRELDNAKAEKNWATIFQNENK